MQMALAQSLLTCLGGTQFHDGKLTESLVLAGHPLHTLVNMLGDCHALSDQALRAIVLCFQHVLWSPQGVSAVDQMDCVSSLVKVGSTLLPVGCLDPLRHDGGR